MVNDDETLFLRKYKLADSLSELGDALLAAKASGVTEICAHKVVIGFAEAMDPTIGIMQVMTDGVRAIEQFGTVIAIGSDPIIDLNQRFTIYYSPKPRSEEQKADAKLGLRPEMPQHEQEERGALVNAVRDLINSISLSSASGVEVKRQQLEALKQLVLSQHISCSDLCEAGLSYKKTHAFGLALGANAKWWLGAGAERAQSKPQA